jgi:DGQHR domain-containing protein
MDEDLRYMAKPKATKKTVLSKEEKALAKLRGDHRKAIRAIFRGAGFSRISGISDKEFIFDNQKTDLDDIFIYENVVVLAEYTCSKSSNIGAHLKNKKIVYDKMLADGPGLIAFLKGKFPESANQFPSNYHKSKIIPKIIYCSRFDFEDHYRQNVPGPIYADYPAVRYFLSVVDAIKKSARYELLHFLEIDPAKVGFNGKVQIGKGSETYRGSILSEAHSNFDEGYKVVSFYADPQTLLQTSYVLRKDGWRDSLNLYQRMISKAKIESIRLYLKKQKRVFINNIIVTLPPDVKPLDEDGETIDTKYLIETAPVIIKLPARPNSVCLVDGQHRVFAYHETEEDDEEIAQLRVQQNLLVTGIIYPKGVNAIEKEKFEARLFLEINSTQATAKAQLKQAISILLDPFATESIAARTLAGLAMTGPLSGFVEQYFFDSGKLKTSSIVSFGLKPLVKTSGSDSLFSIWSHPGKDSLSNKSDDALLDKYVSFCVDNINTFLRSIRRNLSNDRWTTNPKTKRRVLATTYVNSFLIVLRHLINEGVPLDEENVRTQLTGLDQFDMSVYHSSQYARLALNIVKTYFLPPDAASKGVDDGASA